MADFKRTPQGSSSFVQTDYTVTPAKQLGRATNMLGAVLSLVLVVGVGVWGYKLLVRDVSGIPVVRAALGEMRVRPDVPGGEMAEHQGLSVNTVAAIGSADARTDELRLAPQPTELQEEDQPMSQLEEAGMDLGLTEEDDLPAGMEQDTTPVDVAGALESGSIDDLVAELTSGVAAMDAPEDEEDGESIPVLASVDAGEVPAALSGVLSGAGMNVSLRPSVRPAGAAPAQGAQPVAAVAATTAEVDAASVPAGTRLVQLGAFDTPEVARAQWGVLHARFAPFMEGKNRIVMEAKSGGRTFYRLRAEGFEDIADARRFCSALVAESVDCIPVVSR